MSITIVSTPPPSGQAASAAAGADGSSDPAAAGDFASLLLGQLAIAVAPGLVANALPIRSPGVVPTDAAATVDADASVDADAATDLAAAAPADAAALLAALGLVVPPPTTPGSSPQTARTDTAAGALAAPLAALQASASSGESAEVPGKDGLLPTPAALSAPLAGDGAAAKFAVAAPLADSAVDATAIPPDTTQSLSSAIPPQTGNVPANNVHPAQHESSLSVNTPVRDQRWAADLGQKVVWLAANDKQSAQLTLNPAQMGPIEISLNIDKGNATVSFASANAEVRDAIETAMPRLREMFANAGISLGQTNVGAESFSQQAGNDAWKQSSSRLMTDNAILATDALGSLQARAFGTRSGNAMVDIFA